MKHLPPYPTISIPQASGSMRYCPDLALEIGEKVHLFVLQVAYLCNEARLDDRKHNSKDGHWWTYQSLRGWQKKWFKAWHFTTVLRTIDKAITEGYVISDNYNRLDWDKTGWYRPNWKKLATLKSIQVLDYGPAAPEIEDEGNEEEGVLQNATGQKEGVLQNATGVLQNATTIPETPTRDSLEEEAVTPNRVILQNNGPTYFPIDEYGNRIPPKFDTRQHPLFLQIARNLHGRLVGLPADERKNFYKMIIAPSEDIPGFREWCVWQAENNAKGKPWRTYLSYVFRGMDFNDKNGSYTSNYNCDFEMWLRGEFIPENEIERVAGVKKVSTPQQPKSEYRQQLEKHIEEAKW